MSRYTKPYKHIAINKLTLDAKKYFVSGEKISVLNYPDIKVPEGFSITCDAWQALLNENNITHRLNVMLSMVDQKNHANLTAISEKVKNTILDCDFPVSVAREIIDAYKELSENHGYVFVYVKGCTIAEDLNTAILIGQHNTFSEILGASELMIAIKKCFATLYFDRAISNQKDMGISQNIPLYVGVQKMNMHDMIL